MSATTIEKPKKRATNHLTSIGRQVLDQVGTPPGYQSIAVKHLWTDGTGDTQCNYYRVNIYVLHGDQGVVPRMRMSDSYFIKCGSDDAVDGLEKKY